MKGLLLNDYYALRRPASIVTLSALAVMMVFLSIAMTDPAENTLGDCRMFSGFLSLMSVIPIMTLIAEDETSRWQQYYVNTPASRSTYVTEKFLLSLTAELVFSVFISLPSLVLMLRQDSFDMTEYLLSLVLAFGIPSIVISFVFPLSLRFGSSKGAVCFLIIFMVIFAALATVTVLSAVFTGKSRLIDFLLHTESAHLTLYVLAAAVVLVGVSIPVSFAAFRRRQF